MPITLTKEAPTRAAIFLFFLGDAGLWGKVLLVTPWCFDSNSAWKGWLEPWGLSGQQTVPGLFLSVTNSSSLEGCLALVLAQNCVHAGSHVICDGAQREVSGKRRVCCRPLGSASKMLTYKISTEKRACQTEQSLSWQNDQKMEWMVETWSVLPPPSHVALGVGPDAVLSWHGEVLWLHKAQLLDSANGNVWCWWVSYFSHSGVQITEKRSSGMDRLLGLRVQPLW